MVRRRCILVRRRSMLRLIGITVVALAIGAPAGPGGWWSGSYTLGGGPGTFTLRVDGAGARVALGLGHPGLQVVPAHVDGPRVRFSLPGRPTPVTFIGAVSGG